MSLSTVKKIIKDGYKPLAKVLLKYGIDKTTKYMAFREEVSGKFQGVAIPAGPWLTMKLSAKEFFDTLFPERQQKQKPHLLYYGYQKVTRKDLKAHMELAKNYKLLTPKLWIKFLTEKQDPSYYRHPWVAFRVSLKDFFNAAIPERQKIFSDNKTRHSASSPEEHLRLCIENNLTNSAKWRKFYLQNRTKSDILARPWDRLNLSEAIFFTSVRQKRKDLSHGLDIQGNGNSQKPS
jgi:hypothetical protein